MNLKKHLSSAPGALATAAVAVLALANPSAHAGPVWNVNIGSEITTSDNFAGAAPENTAPNSFWNSVLTATPSNQALSDSAGAATTATLTLTPPAGKTLGYAGFAPVTGLELFSTWMKTDGNDTPFTMMLGGLNSSATYDLIVYSDWFWKGDDYFPVTQTVGSGLAGTVYLDQISTGSNGAAPALVQDTNLLQNGATEGNWIRINGLTPAGGTIGFSMGGRNSAFSGFQLVQVGTGAPDNTPPTPSPMTWLSVPAAAGSSSITMTATTASDASGVEYFFDETSGNPGGTDSAWQNSSTYIDTGLSPSTTYTYTVSARDKSAARNPTTASASASATTTAPDSTPPTPSPMTWSSVPVPASSSSITMTATTATDASGVDYFFDETSGNLGGTDSGWQSSPTYTDIGLSPSTSYTYTVTARDRSAALNATTASASASATTLVAPSTIVWNVNIGNHVTTADNYAGAVPQTNPINWNSITDSAYAGLALKDTTGSTAGGITFDLTSDRNTGGQALTSGDKIFIGWFGGAGASSTMTLRGLTISKTYDIVFYSDWYWKNGDSLPITQTAGTGLSGTFFLNRILTGTIGIVPALTQDTNPADVTSGAGNTGNYCRIVGLIPDSTGKVSFRIGDGANTAFSGFQLVQTGNVPPQADMLTLSLASNPPSIRDAVISGTNITLKVPFGTNVTNLAPTYTLWPGATCTTPSGTARNFTTPQTYTVTSSDSLVTKVYSVTALLAPPLPVFTLSAPANWDGRSTITVQPVISNLALLQANNGTNFTYNWSVSGVAVTQTTSPGIMTLTRSQGSGPLSVMLTLNNGTENVTSSTTITVQEPSTDPWVERTPLANERPVDNQFFARNPFTNLGTIFYRGTQLGTPNDVFLKVYRTPSGGSESLYATYRQPLVSGAYDFTATIEAGLFTYRVVYGTRSTGLDTNVATVNNLLCGDAFIIEGQSNAQATANDDATTNPQINTVVPWVKTYDASLGWGPAYAKPLSPEWGSKVGYWGMQLAQDIVAQHSMPVCLINGAVGGTYIAQHQPNPVDRTIGAGTYDIYANLLNRVIAARLTHGIRGVFWHQGESDSASFGPPLEPDYLSYEQNFLDMSSAWKQDYPNFQRYVVFQIAPNPCGIGPFASEVREVQRQLPLLYSKMSLVNSIDVPGYGGCHYTKAGYESLASRVLPVVKRDFYGVTYPAAVTPPNLVRAYFTSSARTAIALQFDQPMSWSSSSLFNWHVNDVANQVTSGSASGNIVTLQLTAAAAANSTLDYVKDTWNYNEPFSTLLYGANGIPALTFANVAIETASPYQSWASSKNLIGAAAPGDADPDFDGVKNALEFVLGGEPNPSSPSANSSALLPISSRNVVGDLVFTFRRKIASVSGVNLTFQWSSDLTFPALNTVPIGAMGSSVDGINVAISNFDVATETIIVTVPAAKAVGSKLFGQLKATVP